MSVTVTALCRPISAKRAVHVDFFALLDHWWELDPLIEFVLVPPLSRGQFDLGSVENIAQFAESCSLVLYGSTSILRGYSSRLWRSTGEN